MKRYYTNVQSIGNFIYYRGIDRGKKVKLRIAYEPKLYLPAKKKTQFKSVKGEYLEEMKFESIREARNFINQYKDVQGFNIYGNSRFEYCFIADEHSEEEIEWKLDEISVAYLDIEVGSESGFPEPASASEPITAITVKLSTKESYFVFGCGEYKKHRNDVDYVRCKDEYTLIKKFLEFWFDNYPDVVTGWNIKGFDIPYLVNRITKIVGEDAAKTLSPWERINVREETLFGRDTAIYDFVGIATLDYLQLYRKYSSNSQESYRLDHIAQEEGVGEKISYDEYENLHQLYKLNFQKFIEYNIRDVELVEKLNAKGRLIDMALTLAYDNKTNYGDVFSQVTMWDAITFNHLKNKNIIVPPKKESFKASAYEGAYVKDPQIGMHDWMVSFDLNSLYPHLIMQYNIGPETLIEPEDYTDEMRKIMSAGVSVDNLLNQKIDLSNLKNVTITPNGQFFKTDKQGFLAEIMERMYDARSIYKKKMIEAQKNYEAEKDPVKKKEYADLVARYSNLQLAKKVGLNSAYGALGNQYFRFFDTRQAEGITLAGQLSIRWIETRINQYMNKILKTNEIDYVIASDTDSIYLKLDGIVKSVYGDKLPGTKVIDFMDRVCEQKLQPYIDKCYQELAEYVHAYAQKMKMKRESLVDKAIWTAKKRYILNVHDSEGVRYTKPKMKIQGLEAIKSSTPSACRSKIKEALSIILSGKESELHQFIANFKEEFKTLPTEDISFPRTVNGVEQYFDKKEIYKKGTPIHVRGTLIYNHMLKERNLLKKYEKIKEGEKIKFIYLREPNPLHSDVISFLNRVPKEFQLEKYVDYELQFNKSFVDPLKIILECIGWKTEKQNTLEAFFS
jgi:DNA polymerase elongation subunit (family B)